jgi:hypothetical protein
MVDRGEWDRELGYQGRGDELKDTVDLKEKKN